MSFTFSLENTESSIIRGSLGKPILKSAGKTSAVEALVFLLCWSYLAKALITFYPISFFSGSEAIKASIIIFLL